MSLTLVFFLALAAVETPQCLCEGDMYCFCSGDGGASLGKYQIQACYVKDVNRIYRINPPYKHEDVYHIDTAEEIIELYIGYWGHESVMGRRSDMRDRVRIHNGGYDGWSEPETFNYWMRFWYELERIEDE